jgi:hypothetical protein
VPVADPSGCESFRQIADDVVCAITAEPLHAVGLWYQDFPQMTDGEVRDLLARFGQTSPSPSGGQEHTSPSTSGGQQHTSPSPSGGQQHTSPSPSGGQQHTSPSPSGGGQGGGI